LIATISWATASFPLRTHNILVHLLYIPIILLFLQLL